MPQDPKNFQDEIPTAPDLMLVPCPACKDDQGRPVGERLVKLPSGTRVRRRCDVCQGLKKLDREGFEKYQLSMQKE